MYELFKKQHVCMAWRRVKTTFTMLRNLFEWWPVHKRWWKIHTIQYVCVCVCVCVYIYIYIYIFFLLNWGHPVVYVKIDIGKNSFSLYLYISLLTLFSWTFVSSHGPLQVLPPCPRKAVLYEKFLTGDNTLMSAFPVRLLRL
jgi:hypothetical protein